MALTCNCPVERPLAPHGAYFTSPRCVLPIWHTGPHQDSTGATSPAFMGGALAWWMTWIRAWQLIGEHYQLTYQRRMP